MLFELPTNTECELATFVGRTQKSGPDDVPAVTFRLKLAGVSNTLLDRFSKTIRHTIYKAVEGQENLPGVEDVTPLLQSKDLVHWAPETCLDGWTVYLARGISDGDALQMGGCKIDAFRFDFFEGGRMDVDFRISTADVDEDGAGMLWGRQKRKVFVTIVAPEMPAEKEPAIDGTKGHPGAVAAQGDAGDLFAQAARDELGAGEAEDGEVGDDQHAGDFGTADEADLAAEAERGGEDWPFPTDGEAGPVEGAQGAASNDEAEQAELEAGMSKAIAAAGLQPKAARRPRRAAGGGME
ncbi:hypothetical protein [Aquabacterium sp. OR-4]|uniref:hypothetical protein n=1 Tax=Aquabacterium sp. OR-4 TaxID=2978127 RepID=UPI0021B37946|nr:hypothetical protein [Aquabacterium sp. OR-4]MDT7835005.1 hypothetical protein [Aquabacterium sp. OR-4]